MSEPFSKDPAATTDAVKAQVQSREEPQARKPTYTDGSPHDGEFVLDPALTRASHMNHYERSGNVPLYRPLRIFLLDPAASRLEGSVGLVNVPFEPLAPGPEGSVLKVEPCGSLFGGKDDSVNLSEEHILLQQGRDPSPSDPSFHQQMLYAVCSLVYATFRAALGREISWGFDPVDGEGLKLHVVPHAMEDQNACYEHGARALKFGYYKAGAQVSGRNIPGERVFTCLSHDIIAHEMTHAILDGLRPAFAIPTSAAVPAFHEGFADLVAIFQHFSYPEVVANAIHRSRGDVGSASLLLDLARQFGHTTEGKGPLRSAIDWFDLDEVEEGGAGDEAQIAKPRELLRYREDLETHQLGSVLVSAVFEAFVVVFRRKTRRYFRLASGGTGVLPAGDIPKDLETVLADAASKLASQFLSMAIRAIDYCPPVDITFGDYLRALITADYDLVPDDPWGYREALMDAFRRREIYPEYAAGLYEDALRWKPPRVDLAAIADLSFSEMHFQGDPGRVMDAHELTRQGEALGRALCHPRVQKELSLGKKGQRTGSGVLGPLEIQTIRTARRVGPDGQIVFDLVAEVIQRCMVEATDHRPGYEVLGGATIIFGPDGSFRYVVSKSPLKDERPKAMGDFLASSLGKELWDQKDGKFAPRGESWSRVHKQAWTDAKPKRRSGPASNGAARRPKSPKEGSVKIRG